MKSRGIYVGTLRLEKPWYARKIKQGGFPARGSGESESITRVEVGLFHGITFSWTKILKIGWQRGRERLSSGFIVPHADQVKQALTTTGWA
jgi:hypothetical protein